MTQKRWNGSAYVDLTTKKRWDGAAWINLTIGKRWDGAAWQDVLGGGSGALSVTANPGNLTGVYHATGPYPLFATVYSSGSVVVTPNFGTGPYTCVWTHVSGDSAIQVEFPTEFTTRFVANVGREQEVIGTKRCNVTDSLGATGFVDIPGHLYYTTDL